MRIPAKFPGWCWVCELAINIGDQIELDDDGYKHTDCTPKRERPTVTCTECWLIKPCECEDS